MANKQIFLSHIHDEYELAFLIKTAVEDEFSGFVDVFVSSDGTSIPAGVKFLNYIETALANCAAAIYLISPTSVKKNWINFELGAVWIRNTLSLAGGGGEIPTVPLCHSGMTPSDLPTPLSSLNAVPASDPRMLYGAFKSLQGAVGARGDLRTNFNALAEKIAALEKKYIASAPNDVHSKSHVTEEYKYPDETFFGPNILGYSINDIAIGKEYSLAATIPNGKRLRLSLSGPPPRYLEDAKGAWGLSMGGRNWTHSIYDQARNIQVFDAGPGDADLCFHPWREGKVDAILMDEKGNTLRSLSLYIRK